MKTKQISVLEYSQKINPAYFRKNQEVPRDANNKTYYYV